MAGLIPERGGQYVTRRITKADEHSNPVIRSFTTFFGAVIFVSG